MELNASTVERFKKGTQVWIKDDEKVWRKATLDVDFSGEGQQLQLVTDTGQTTTYDWRTLGLPFLCNPKILIGQDDLTTLSHLHEPAVLHNLNHRFLQLGAVYTYCGIVLVAVNPYQDCPDLYGHEMMQVYRGVGKQTRVLDPHVYAVAEEAYFDMTEYDKSQSVIVSGESGAGKTVSAKLVMRYLAQDGVSSPSMDATTGVSLGGGKATLDATTATSSSVEEKVLASNPIMEAMGNAKTTRNDNSSRFGKYIQMNFNTAQKGITGAAMRTYLLEKSRVVFQAHRERNYHIFYQICAAAEGGDAPLLDDLALEKSSAYHYTSQGGTGGGTNERESDATDFADTDRAFRLLGFSDEERRGVYTILAGILELGNIAVEMDGCASLKTLCDRLYGIDGAEFTKWLRNREIKAAGETVETPMDAIEALAGRDALAKEIYARLFRWIVAKINGALALTTEPTRKIPTGSLLTKLATAKQTPTGTTGFIGVLDIYGFETFEVNSFEQFCINYANEKLQQQFNLHVFKLEQEEYEREAIAAWVRVDFSDNQPCIDLIECRLGLIDLLDEQCKVGRGTDMDWLQQVRTSNSMKKSKHLHWPKTKPSAFIVRHFAADVTYTVDGFVDKNKDRVSERLLGVLALSKLELLRLVLFGEAKTNEDGSPIQKKAMRLSVFGGAGKKQSNSRDGKKTVSHQFRESLKDLMEILAQTRPHYVRCIKPNDGKLPFTFHPKRAIQQLRACGVLETVRISAAGYPSRWNYEEFGSRYRSLYTEGKGLWRDDPKNFADKACTKTIQDRTKFALGTTKIFFRTGQVAYLERLRSEIRSTAVITIQCAWRRYRACREHAKLRHSLLTIQNAGRAYLMWRYYHYLRMHRATLLIQKVYRGWTQRREFMATRTIVVALQARWRGVVVRRQIRELRLSRMVLRLQSVCRGYLRRRQYRQYLQKVVCAQSAVRRWLAKRQLRQLKIEAKSVNHLQTLNSDLANKMISLQQRLEASEAERGRLATCCDMAESDTQKRLLVGMQEVDMLKRELLEMSARVDIERTARDAADRCAIDLQREMEQQVKVFAKMSREKEERIQELTSELAPIRHQLQQLQEELKKTEIEKSTAEKRASLLAKDQRELLEADEFLGVLSRTPSARLRRPPIGDATTDAATADFRLIVRQQGLISRMREEKEKLQRDLDKLVINGDAAVLLRRMDDASSNQNYYRLRAQELEIASMKLKDELDRLLDERVSFGVDGMNFHRIFDATLEENDRLKEETTELRAMLAAAFIRSSNVSSPTHRHSGYSSHSPSSVSSRCTTSEPRVTTPDAGSNRETEDEEMTNEQDLFRDQLCCERLCRDQKTIIEQLTCQLEDCHAEVGLLQAKLTRIETGTVDERSLADILAPLMTLTDDTELSGPQIQNLLHGELNRLSNENMQLQNKLDRSDDHLRQARAQLKGSMKHGFDDLHIDGVSEDEIVRVAPMQRADGSDVEEHSALLEITNVTEFVRLLIYDLKPRLARMLTTAGLPAYALLMAFRYYDHTQDEVAISTLFTSAHLALKDTLNMSDDLDVNALWLVNSWKLLNLLRQYSNEECCESFAAKNTAKQTEQLLRHFDLAPMREKLTSRVEDAYQNFMKRCVEPILAPKIVPAILQHCSAQTAMLMDGLRGGGATPTKTSVQRKTSQEGRSEQALDDLLELLNIVHSKLIAYGADPPLLGQVFGQICSWVCALALNHLMFRRDMCNLGRAIQIKHNLTELKCWLNDRGLRAYEERLEPLIEASHLLQSRKDETNLDTICCEITSRLKPKQVVTLLQHYAPCNEFEESRLSAEFLQKVADRLAVLRTSDAGGEVDSGDGKPIMMGTYLLPLDTSEFVYSEVRLETISLPKCLRLQEVAKLL